MNNNTNNESKKTLYTVAYAFSIVGTVMMALLCLIPLVWCIPMTIAIKKAGDQIGTPQEQQHTTLGILSLIFVSLIAGICVLVADSQTNKNNNQNDNEQPTIV